MNPSVRDMRFVAKAHYRRKWALVIGIDNYAKMGPLLQGAATEPRRRQGWAPLGRFAWKQREHRKTPLPAMIAEAKEMNDTWPPLVAGLFGRSMARFEGAAGELQSFIAKLNWH